jgi:hypothetical protein
MYDVIDNIIVDAKVRMDKTITHGCDCSPFHLRVRLAERIWDLFDGFPDNFDAPHNGTLQKIVMGKRLMGDGRLIGTQKRRFIKDMLEVLT